MFFVRARAGKGIVWHTDASNMVWTLIYHGKLANQIVRLATIVVKLLITPPWVQGILLPKNNNLMYRSFPKPPPPPLGHAPGHLNFVKILVKSPTLQVKQNHLPLEINRIAYLWKQVLQNFQPLRISYSACLRSML